jgi:putative aminopeptidase FrvX
MKKKSKEFLKEYLNNPSPTGFEAQMGSQKIWADYIAPFVKNVELDEYGTAIAVMGNIDSDYKVVIEAHADEIAWYVNYIDEKGYIRVVANGGSDNLITPSMRVNLWGRKGKVNGVFGHPAIHIQKNDLKINLDSMFIDIGATTKQEVLELGVEVGTPITFKDGFMEDSLGENWITGRALDNKIGGFMIAEVARKLNEKGIELPYKLYIVNSVQEEIGLKGAEMVARNIMPNVAICLDVCHDTTSPCYDETKQGQVKAMEGAVLSVSPSVHNNLLNYIRKVLDNEKLPYQMTASSTYTGTDTDVFAYTGSGIPSCLISLPLKYMHTTIETCAVKDVKLIIKSLIAILTDIKVGQSFKYKL